MTKRELIETLNSIIEEEILISKEQLNDRVTQLVSDTRAKIQPGSAFVCIKGAKCNGHEFADEANRQGASVIIAEWSEKIIINSPRSATLILVSDTRKAWALLSAAWFNYPAREMKTIGITGTKGKSTTCYMIRDILKAAGRKVGVIGTIGICVGEKVYDTNNTTPDSYLVQKYMREMADSGCDTVVMEVSSQGLKQHRAYGINFDYALFTNIGHDHIGGVEHADFEEYLYCKSLLFKQCSNAIVNIDDEHVSDMLENSHCNTEGFTSGKNRSDINCNTEGFTSGKNQTDIINCSEVLSAGNISLYNENGETGIMFDYSSDKEAFKGSVRLPIPGRFNVMNAMAAIAVCRHFTKNTDVIAEALGKTFVLGRLEPVRVSERFTVLIDYAHNAMALESVLNTLREYNPKRLVCLFGCGGDRAKDRRFEMGEVSSRLADLTVVTSDNPRTEKPEDIIADIMTGVKRADGDYVMIPDRCDAIRYVLENAQDGDVILLAGKGNETYQEINGVKYHMDEREIVRDAWKAIKG